jgi:S-adenosylmethionine:tRNA ribosyltransferase-isomerase
MRIEELDFPYPESLVATERALASRVLVVENGEPREILPEPGAGAAGAARVLLGLIEPGDVLVVNDTKVLRRRVFSESGLEILFLSSDPDLTTWQVLCPSTRWKDGEKQALPGGVSLELVSRGRPQTVRTSQALNENYFAKHGELPLPPYIQKARSERHNRTVDSRDYQTAWAKADGSLAAPTASLHFSNDDLTWLKSRGVLVCHITLHVGLGTFLPVTAERLEDHVMHAEIAEISGEVWSSINKARARGRKIWALGTTVTRTLESAAIGKLQARADGGFFGATDLFIQPGFEFQVVDRLMTNFHQPRSTLIALVAAFADIDLVKRV